MVMVDENSLSKLLGEEVKLKLIEPHIYSVCQDAQEDILYDKMAKFYDLVICNRFYNHIVWGYPIASYGALVYNALTSSKSGWVLEAGCGSLAFTAKTYAGYSERPIILLDKSLNLLRIAKSRLIQLNRKVPENLVFLQGDALQLPFKPQCLGTIISMNLLHVIPEIDKLVMGIKNVLKNNGNITFTTLVKSNRFFANRYLNFMGRMGEAVPRSINQLLTTFNELGMPVQHQVVGNMAFINYG
jgi:ubiquinone/menaquinone biosynthesis C-methylase UbiE